MITKYEAITDCINNDVLNTGFKKICNNCNECKRPKNQLRIYAENKLAKAMNITIKQAEQILLYLDREARMV